MLQPPVFNSQEEVDAYLDVVGGGAAGIAEGFGIIDLLAGVPWLARETAGQQVLSTMLRERDRLERHTDKKTADYFQRLDLRSKGVLGNEKSPKIALNTIAGRSGTYDDAIENTLESLGYNKTEQSEVARQVAFLTTLGIDLAFLTKVIIQNAPRGYRAVRDALKNMGKNVDEADQAVMRAEMETGMSETPLLPKPEMPWGEEIYKMEKQLAQLENLEASLYGKFKNVDEVDQAVIKTEMETGMPQKPVQMEINLEGRMNHLKNLYKEADDIVKKEETRLYEIEDLLTQHSYGQEKGNWTLRDNTVLPVRFMEKNKASRQQIQDDAAMSKTNIQIQTKKKRQLEKEAKELESRIKAKDTQEQIYGLETRLYELNNLLRQEGGSMSKTNFQELNALIDKTQSKLNKLKDGNIILLDRYKNGGIVQNSVDYALEQWT